MIQRVHTSPSIPARAENVASLRLLRLCHLLGGMALLLLQIPLAEAGTVTLQWDPNPETTIAGYIVSYGTMPGQYSEVVDVGNQTWFAFAEPDPTDIYYFVVQAYD